MSKSAELRSTTELVKDILMDSPKARSSDNYLYYLVCATIGRANGIDVNKMSMPVFLLKMSDFDFPPFESVRRSRQKLQAKYPELSADADTEAYRTLNEEIYRSYARSEV